MIRACDPRSGCPLSAALELFGDSWSLLIVRDLMFKLACTFNDFLSADEGIASNILADRLQRLEAARIIDKSQDPNDARRYVYRLTEKGVALAPAMIEMLLWAADHARADDSSDLIKKLRTNKQRVLADLRKSLLAERERAADAGSITPARTAPRTSRKRA